MIVLLTLPKSKIVIIFRLIYDFTSGIFSNEQKEL